MRTFVVSINETLSGVEFDSKFFIQAEDASHASTVADGIMQTFRSSDPVLPNAEDVYDFGDVRSCIDEICEIPYSTAKMIMEHNLIPMLP